MNEIVSLRSELLCQQHLAELGTCGECQSCESRRSQSAVTKRHAAFYGGSPEDVQRKIAEAVSLECAAVQARAKRVCRSGSSEILPGQWFDNAHQLSFAVGNLLRVLDMA
jgi:hypothetical protein